MSTPCLYVNPKGQPWRKHSYSAGLDFEQSPKKYYFKRVLGWRESDNKCSLKFGRALESALQFYHENKFEPDSGVTEFIRLWSLHKEETLKYTKKEKTWDNMLAVGTDMMKLYEIRRPSLPVTDNAIFQREYEKEVFPNDENYGGLIDAGKIDMISFPEPNHPMLPKIDWKPEYGLVRQVIVDIKTAGNDYPAIKGECARDPQLRRYSWLSGIFTVGLVWFKKCSPSLKKKYSVTLLQDCEDLKAGDEAVVAQVLKDGTVYIVRNDYFIDQMHIAQGRKKNKAGVEKLDTTGEAEERRDLWLAKNATLVPVTSLTRQRLQFDSGLVSKESALEAGYIAGDQIQGIVNSWKRNVWPDKFKARPPHMDLNDSYYKAFSRNDEQFRKDNFTQVINDDLDLFTEDELDLDDEPDED